MGRVLSWIALHYLVRGWRRRVVEGDHLGGHRPLHLDDRGSGGWGCHRLLGTPVHLRMMVVITWVKLPKLCVRYAERPFE